MNQYSGQCLCGGIQFQIHGELEPIQICYCKQCQRAQGTVFATNIPVNTNDFQLLKGQELIRKYESSPGKLRSFCGQCGSPLYSQRATLPNVLRIRAGLIDGDLPVQLEAHCYVSSKPNWWSIRDDVPQYQEALPVTL